MKKTEVNDTYIYSELVNYIMEDAVKWCVDSYDFQQNKDFWLRYSYLTDEDIKVLNRFYDCWTTPQSCHPFF